MRLAWLLFLMLPTVAALVWTAYPVGLTAIATWNLPSIRLSVDELEDPHTALRIRRKIQKHFLDYSVYIPMEDVVIPASMDPTTEHRVSLLMQKACGQGKLFLWLPFRFRIPVLGTKVIEWCWIPPIEKTVKKV